MGQFYFRDIPVAINDLGFLQPDRFGRRGTPFLANDAGNPRRPRQTTALIEKRRADSDRGRIACSEFGFRFEFRYSPGGADMPAESTIMFAISDLRRQDRSEDTLPPGFEQCRLKSVGGADFHTLPASDTAFEKIFLY